MRVRSRRWKEELAETVGGAGAGGVVRDLNLRGPNWDRARAGEATANQET